MSSNLVETRLLAERIPHVLQPAGGVRCLSLEVGLSKKGRKISAEMNKAEVVTPIAHTLS